MRSMNLVYDLPKLNANTITCETYFRGKQSRVAFSSDMPKKLNDALEVMTYGICDPLKYHH